MNAIQRVEFLIEAERTSVVNTQKLLEDKGLYPFVRRLMEADVRKTSLMIQHLELILAELKG